MKLGALEQRWTGHLAQFKLKIHYRPGKLNSHADALSPLPVECPGEDVDSNQEDIEVTPVLPTPSASCTIKKQEADQQIKAAELCDRDEQALIHKKDPGLIQVQNYLSQKHKPTSREC